MRSVLPGEGLTCELPPSIGNLTALRRLNMPYNGITGTLPVEIGGLINLEFVDFELTLLSGEISDNIFNNMLNLKSINLACACPALC